MNLAGKILCKTAGTAGMGIALYDAMLVGKQFSRNGAGLEQSKYLENAYFNSRTVDDVSFSSKAIANKTFDLRTRNPLPSLWGRLKGAAKGALQSLGNSLPIVACSALSLIAKGKLAKAGAAGVVLSLGYNILHNGFGLGKKTPMD